MNKILALSALRPGESGRVHHLLHRGPMRRRLRDLGFIEGTPVRCLGRSPGGDPAAFAVFGAVLALRDADSGQILIKKDGDAP